MKRHPAFVELSRDHHDGLLLAVRLQQGKKALERLWSHDPAWQANYVKEFFAQHLEEHFRLEEEFLFPAAAAINAEGKKTASLLLEEHAELRRLTATLPGAENAALAPTLAEFGKILERHIRCEERELFPFCERHMTEDDLTKLVGLLNP